MGIGFVDSIIVYNQYKSKNFGEEYFGTRFDNVRVELTPGANITESGIETASACIAKITDESIEDSGKVYIAPKVWLKLPTEEKVKTFTLNEGIDFYVIVKKSDLGIDIDLPVGEIQSETYNSYDGGFFEYVKTKFGFAYSLYKADSFGVIRYQALYGK